MLGDKSPSSQMGMAAMTEGDMMPTLIPYQALGRTSTSLLNSATTTAITPLII